MQIIVKQSELHEIVSHARPVAKAGAKAGPKTENRILEHVLLVAEIDGLQGRLVITAMDSVYITLQRTVSCQVITPGSVALSASRLLEATSVLPGKEDVTITVDPESSYTTLQASLIKATLRGVPADQYPKTEFVAVESSLVAIEPLVSLFKRMLFSVPVAPDTTMPAIGFSHLTSSGMSVRFAGVQRIMIAIFKADLEFPICDELIPRKGLDEIIRALESISKTGAAQCSIGISSGHLMVRGASLTLGVKLGTGIRRIEWEKLLNAAHKPDAYAVFGRDPLIAALRTITTLAEDDRANFTLSSNKLTLASNDSRDGSTIFVEVAAEYSGDHFHIGLNARELAGILSHLMDGSDLVSFALGYPGANGISHPLFICPGPKYSRDAEALAMFQIAIPKPIA